MMLVLIVHANYYSIGTPDRITQIYPDTIRILIQSISVICVNIFVLISGYWHIKLSLKNIVNLVFQCFFYTFIMHTYLMLNGEINIANYFYSFINTISNYWFITAYIGLCLFSPILNSYLKNVNRHTLLCLLTTILLYFTYFSFIRERRNEFEGILLFILLYCIGDLIKKYEYEIKNIKQKYIVLGYILMLLSSIIIEIFRINIGFRQYIFSYSSPTTILESAFFICMFLKYDFKSKIINKIAQSSLAIYLLHQAFYYRPIFQHTINTLYKENNIIAILMYLLTLAILAILIDQIRIYIYNKFKRLIP